MQIKRLPSPRSIRRNAVLLFTACLILAAFAAVRGLPSGTLSTLGTVHFTNVQAESGITFRQDSTQSDQRYYLETMGTGVAWIDYDQDGLPDLYFVQSAATDAYRPSHPLRSALYHNNGDGTFTDVTGRSGLGGEGHYGQGVAAGDYDNDGFPDLYVTGYGRAILYHNNNDGTFTDVTMKAGVGDEGNWSTSAAWFDYDRDGWLDLVVTNYIDWTPSTNLWCGDHNPGYRSYCHPDNYKGEYIKLYHNNHDGTFTDVSKSSGIGIPLAKGMGVVTADFNNDGWPDIAIANDTWPNFLFINNHNSTFTDASFVSSVAASGDGRYEAGMGIDAADVDGDGWADIYITHLDNQLNRLYHNNHDGTFDDDTYPYGIAAGTRTLSGVAMKFIDYDNDGWMDILQANGAMLDNISLYNAEISYKEPLLMFHNTGSGKFQNISSALGPDFEIPICARGLAIADYDNDGDPDFVTSDRGDLPELMRNDGGNRNHWLEVKLIGTKSNRDAIGASLKLTAEGFTEVRQVTGGGSYMSASDTRLIFGLGSRMHIGRLEITWPSGHVDLLKDLPIDHIIAVKEAAGIVHEPFPRIPERHETNAFGR
jgi:hypothetical protein